MKDEKEKIEVDVKLIRKMNRERALRKREEMETRDSDGFRELPKFSKSAERKRAKAQLRQLGY